MRRRANIWYSGIILGIMLAWVMHSFFAAPDYVPAYLYSSENVLTFLALVYIVCVSCCAFFLGIGKGADISYRIVVCTAILAVTLGFFSDAGFRTANGLISVLFFYVEPVLIYVTWSLNRNRGTDDVRRP